MQTVMIGALTFFLVVQVLAMPVQLQAEPYKGEPVPEDTRLFKSLKRVLTETGRLYFGELRLVGKKMSLLGNRQIFFCIGLQNTGVDLSKKQRAMVPKFVAEHPRTADDLTGPLDLYADCFVFDIVRLDSGIWVMQQGAHFVVIEE